MKSRLSTNHANQEPSEQDRGPAAGADESRERRRSSDGDANGATTAAPAAAPVLSDPQPHAPTPSSRPSGQRVVGALLVVGIVVLGYFAWDSVFRFRAFGIVTGNLVELSAPWSGTVATVCVEDGETVRQGEPLVVLHSPELASDVAQVQDDLLAARAALEAEVARLVLTANDQFDRSRDAWADFYLLQGDLQSAEAKLAEISDRLDRYQPLVQNQIVPEQDMVSTEFELQGQQALVDRYTDALEARKKRADASEPTAITDRQLAPFLARVQVLLGQLKRLRDRQSLGTIRAPFDGRVVRVEPLVNEYVDSGAAILAVVQTGTTEVEIHVRQRDSGLLRAGQLAEVNVSPHCERLRCRVMRVEPRFAVPPAQVRMRYRQNEQTLAVHLKPLRIADTVNLPLGAEARLVSINKSAPNDGNTQAPVATTLP